MRPKKPLLEKKKIKKERIEGQHLIANRSSFLYEKKSEKNSIFYIPPLQKTKPSLSNSIITVFPGILVVVWWQQQQPPVNILFT